MHVELKRNEAQIPMIGAQFSVHRHVANASGHRWVRFQLVKSRIPPKIRHILNACLGFWRTPVFIEVGLL